MINATILARVAPHKTVKKSPVTADFVEVSSHKV